MTATSLLRHARRARPLRTAGALLGATALVLGVAGPAPAAYDSTPVLTYGVNNTVYALTTSDTVVQGHTVSYLGGSFTALKKFGVGSTPTALHVAAIDQETGNPLAGFKADTNGTVRALTVSPDGQVLYIGGTFTTVNGVSATNLAAVSALDGTVIPGFTATANSTVRDLVIDGNYLYLAGTFSQVDGVTHVGLARVDPLTGVDDPNWKPRTGGGKAWTMRVSSDNGGSLIVGGDFTSLGTSPNNLVTRNFLGSVSLLTGSTTPWNPTVCDRCFVYDVDTSPTSVYAATAGPGGRLYDFDRASGSSTPVWTDHADGNMQAVEYSATDNLVYVGGHFDANFEYGPAPQAFVVRHQLAAVDPASGVPDMSFAPQSTKPNPGVYAVLITPVAPASPDGSTADKAGYLLAGGGFTGVTGTSQTHYEQFPVTPPAIDPSPPGV